MYIRRNFPFKGVIRFSGGHVVWLSLWATIPVLLYELAGLTWLSLPWLPLSIIGIAVAFYVGFKNNSAYDRMWEARKIWGAIVNDSRSWAAVANHFVSDTFRDSATSEELFRHRKTLIYRHIAWLYTLRQQLLVPTPWEHLRANKHVRRINEARLKTYGTGLFEDQAGDHDERMKTLLSTEDIGYLTGKSNQATQLVDRQANQLKELRKDKLIDDFRHMDMQTILNRFYDHQGKCERIKKYPLPRQYASMSFYFVCIFIFLLPFGMMPEFNGLGDGLIWLSIPFTVLIGWVFVMMELVGDYSENPFEGLGNDIPMLALCRTIEIDLRETLGETDLPPAIEAKNWTLM